MFTTLFKNFPPFKRTIIVRKLIQFGTVKKLLFGKGLKHFAEDKLIRVQMMKFVSGRNWGKEKMLVTRIFSFFQKVFKNFISQGW